MNDSIPTTQVVSLSSSNAIAPERVWRWILEYDPESFEWFVIAAAKKRADLYDWDIPACRPGESKEDYQLRVDASVMELTGKTLSSIILSARGYAGIWASRILERGLTIIPDFLVDDRSKGLEKPLREWFDECHLRDAIGSDAVTRIVSYLLEVVPQARRYGAIDDSIVALLVDENKGFSFPRKARTALDAIRIARKRDGSVPEELGRAITRHLQTGDRDADAMEREITWLGYAPSYAKRYPWAIAAATFLRTAEGEPATDYLIRAVGQEQIDFVDAYLEKGPFDVRPTLGAAADQARRDYAAELDHTDPTI